MSLTQVVCEKPIGRKFKLNPKMKIHQLENLDMVGAFTRSLGPKVDLNCLAVRSEYIQATNPPESRVNSNSRHLAPGGADQINPPNAGIRDWAVDTYLLYLA